MSNYDWSPLVEVLAACAGLPARLLVEHRDDSSGRCHVCGSTRTGRYRWPCATRELAVLALTRQAELRLPLDFPGPTSPVRAADEGPRRKPPRPYP